MAADTIVESVELEVQSEKRKGQGGKDYDTLFVEHKGKKWTIGKKSADHVKKGNTYDFNLQKSEWNDKIYYWANLNEDVDDKSEKKDKADDDKKDSSNGVTNTQVVEYFKALPMSKKISMLQYLLGVMGEK